MRVSIEPRSRLRRERLATSVPCSSIASTLFLTLAQLLDSTVWLDGVVGLQVRRAWGHQPAAPLRPPTAPQSTAEFATYTEESNINGVEVFQTVTFNWPHRTFSLEELRLNDYAHGRGLVPRARSAGHQARSFTTSTNGLVAASVPNTFGQGGYASCRTPNFLDIDFGSESITLRVGKEGESKDFLVHRNILTRHSAYMQEALMGDWKEAITGIIPLSDDKPDVIELYQKWLYTGCIFSEPPRGVLQEGGGEYEKLVNGYILGEKLLDSTFKDCVIDAIISLLLTSRLFDPTLSGLVYDSTPPASALRRLWQDIYIFCGSPSWLDDTFDPHTDFAIDLSRRQMAFLQGFRPQDGANVLLKPCSYHEHDSGKCYRVASVPVLSDGASRVISALWS